MAQALVLVLPRMSVGQRFHGLPYAVRGLCTTWQAGNWIGPKRRPRACYRATMVVNTWFGHWSV